MRDYRSFYETDVNTFILVENDDFYLFKRYGENYKCILKTRSVYGKNGFSQNKTEGDGKTPVGIFDLNFAFGFLDSPRTELDYIKVDRNYYYVDDAQSSYYNKLVDKRRVLCDWKSAEHLCDYKKEYCVAINIDYNPECIKGKGSAIILHCIGDKDYTSGCIAIEKEKLLFCLDNLEKGSKIIINPTVSGEV